MRDLSDDPNANILRAFPARDDGKWSAKLSIYYAGHIQVNLNSSRSRKGGVAEQQSRCWGQRMRRHCVFDDVEDDYKAEQPSEREHSQARAICFAKNIYCSLIIIIIVLWLFLYFGCFCCLLDWANVCKMISCSVGNSSNFELYN